MSRAPIRVLVVEDQADHAMLIRRTLVRQVPPFEVTIVPAGEACLAALERSAVDIVLLDYSLPGLNGLEVLARVRQRGISIPVVMVTAQGDERVAVDAMQAGATDYVLKTSGYLATLPTVLYKALKQFELSVENARLYAETRDRLRDTEALLEMTRVLTGTLELGSVIEKVAEAASRACRMGRCAIYLVNGDRIVSVDEGLAGDRAAEGAPGMDREGIPLDDAPAIAAAVHGRCPVRVHETIRGGRGRLRGVSEAAVALVLPLARADAVIGVLVLERGEAGADVTSAQVELGTAVASHIALALENARLYRDARKALTDLKTAQDQLVRGQTLHALGELASGAAHHLNNLLAVIQGRVQLLMLDARNVPILRPLTIVERAVKDGAEVVRRIQEFARMRPADVTEAVDLDRIVAEVVEMTRARWDDEATAHGVHIDVTCECGSVPTVRGHGAALREVLTNLVLNSVDAMPKGGRITMRTWVEPHTIGLSVADTGVGMSEEVRRRAQEPFFTTKGLKRTGLGLSVSYGIIQRHGGEMLIESAEGHGTTVTIRLPLDGGVSPEHDDASATGDLGPPLRVLVVDDDPDVRDTLVELIEGDAHVVTAAPGPREALAVIEGGAVPDVVLTDLGMPGMTGWDVARAVKARWPNVTVGLVTGWSEEPPRASEEAPADFVLAKPVDLDRLRRVLATARCKRPGRVEENL